MRLVKNKKKLLDKEKLKIYYETFSILFVNLIKHSGKYVRFLALFYFYNFSQSFHKFNPYLTSTFGNSVTTIFANFQIADNSFNKVVTTLN